MNRTDQPLITIVTVVFNDHELLEQTIQSVLGQTYPNIEYIIIDGGSTDGTQDVIRRYEDRIARWVSEPDKGLYDAMNKGIGLASGEWINFMNAGDRFFAQDTVNTVARAMDDTVDLIYGHCQMIYRPDFSVVWKAGDTKDLWKGMIFRHQSLFTRAAVCRSILFDVAYRVSGDFAFIYSCYRRQFRFRSLDTIVSSVSLGGFSDLNLVEALRENRHIVMSGRNAFLIRLYYGYTILLLRIKTIIKTILPDRLVTTMRAKKYG